MTLTEALQKLQEAGRVRSAWLPGMRVTYPKTKGDAEFSMLLTVRYDLTEPKVEAWDGLDLLRFTLREDGWVVEIRGTDDGFTPWDHEPITCHASPRKWRHDLADPATVGCLLALLREASGDPRARVEPYLLGSQGWHIAGRGPLIDLVIDAPSEGEAIAAALIALAEAT